MELTVKNIVLHGQQEMKILTPSKLNHDTTLISDGKGGYLLISNGTGYSTLSELFALGVLLKTNEFIYLPFEFDHMNVYKTDFPNECHYAGLLLANYCTSQFQARDMVSAIKLKTCKKDKTERTYKLPKENVDIWKTQHRTTVKECGQFIIISTNADGFTSFAQSCSNLASYGDDVQYNEYPPHAHHNWNENTSKSLGIIFFYWQSHEMT